MLGAAVVIWLFFSLAYIAASGWDAYAEFLGGSAPAWVQAIGSVMAIFAAIWIGQNQLSAARRLEAEKQDRSDILKTEVLYSLFGEAEALCGQCLESLEDPGRARERLARTLVPEWARLRISSTECTSSNLRGVSCPLLS